MYSALVRSSLAKRLLFLVLVFAVGILCAAGFARAASWTNLTYSSQRFTYSIAVSSTGVKQAAVSSGYLWTSTDSGATWTRRIGGGTGMAMSADGTKIVVEGATNQSYIYTSTDSGATWATTTAGNRYWGSIGSSGDGQIILAADDTSNAGYLYISTDGGSTWATSTSAGARWWGAVVVSADGTYMAAADNATGGYIYTSTDGGTTWTPRFHVNGRRWYSLAASTNGATTTAASGFGTSGLFISTNGGVTWATTTAGTRDWGAVGMSPDGTKIVAGVGYLGGTGTSSNLFISTDGGVTWTDRSSANHYQGSYSYPFWTAIALSDDGTHIAAGTNGFTIHESTDSGSTWSFNPAYEMQLWSALAVSSDGATVVASVRSGATPGSIYKTTDNGATWTVLTNAGSRLWDPDLAMSTSTATIFESVNGSYIYRSLDGGSTWTTLTTFGTASWGDIAVSSDGTRVLVTKYNNQIFTSTDSGDNFTQRTGSWSGSLIFVANASSADGTKLVVVDRTLGQIWMSTSSGATWSKVFDDPTYGFFTVAMSSDGQVILAPDLYAQGVWLSTDGGSTWANKGSSMTSGSRAWWTANVSADGTVLMIGDTSGYVWTSFDQGTTWRSQLSGFYNWSSVGASSDGSIMYALTGSTQPTINGIYTATVSRNTPIISAVSATPAALSSTVTWTTDLAATGRVYYGTTTAYGSASTLDASLVTSHTRTLTSLTCGTTYHYEVTSQTEAMQWATSTDATFSTDTCTGVAWTDQTASGNRSWYSITSSDDGTKLAAVDNWGDIYTSTDAGVTWTDQTLAGALPWYAITSSADGSKLAVVTNTGDIYTSTNSGVNWTDQTTAGSRNWYSITSSSDGLKLAAVVYGGDIYTSADGGATWTDQTAAGTRNWSSITSSTDGTQLAASVYGGDIYTSADSGATWTDQTGSGSRNWQSITSSSNGAALAAVVYGGGIYTSADSGVTWTNQTGAGSRDWYSITSSDDGTRLAAVVYNGGIYTSADSGVTWTLHNQAPLDWWISITSSADGTKLAAAGYTDIWTATLTFGGTAPVVTTNAASSISTTVATLNATITSVGSDAPTTRGFVYGTTAAYGATTTESNGGGFSTGAYTASLTSLTCATTYYVNSYVTNTTVTVYGTGTTFSTSACASGGGGGGSGQGTGGAWTGMTFGPTTPYVPTITLPVTQAPPAATTPTSPVRRVSPPPPKRAGAGSGGGPPTYGPAPLPEVPAVPVEQTPTPPPPPPSTNRAVSRSSVFGTAVSTLQNLATPLMEAIKENETVAKAGAISIGVLALFARPPLSKSNFLWRLRNVADLSFMQLFSLNGLMWFFGLRKRRRYWGTVYDSVTKQPLDPAFVELIDDKTKKVVEESFTDMEGKFGFLDRPGTYTIRTQKTHYRFPSQIVKDTVDGAFANVYHGEVFSVRAEASVIAPNIPMDQLQFDWNQQEKKRMGFGIFGFKLDTLLIKALQIFFWGGLVAVIVIFLVSPSVKNAGTVLVYLLLAALEHFLPKPRLWGQVTSTRHDVKGLLVQLRHPTLPDVIVGKSVTSASGKFFLKVSAGAYTLEILTPTRDVVIHRRTITVGKNMIVNDILAV